MVGPPVQNLLGFCATPVAQDPAKSGSWTTGIAQNPAKFGTGGPTTVSFNTAGPARSAALTFGWYRYWKNQTPLQKPDPSPEPAHAEKSSPAGNRGLRPAVRSFRGSAGLDFSGTCPFRGRGRGNGSPGPFLTNSNLRRKPTKSPIKKTKTKETNRKAGIVFKLPLFEGRRLPPGSRLHIHFYVL